MRGLHFKSSSCQSTAGKNLQEVNLLCFEMPFPNKQTGRPRILGKAAARERSAKLCLPKVEGNRCQHECNHGCGPCRKGQAGQTMLAGHTPLAAWENQMWVQRGSATDRQGQAQGECHFGSFRIVPPHRPVLHAVTLGTWSQLRVTAALSRLASPHAGSGFLMTE